MIEMVADMTNAVDSNRRRSRAVVLILYEFDWDWQSFLCDDHLQSVPGSAKGIATGSINEFDPHKFQTSSPDVIQV